MIEWKNLDQLDAFAALKKTEKVCLPKVMAGAEGAERVSKYQVPMAEGMSYNFAAKAVDDEILSALQKLADEA